jgi:RNA polymerase-binding transcription factor DksA
LAARPAAPKAAPKSAPARRPAFAAEAAPAAPFEDAPGFSSADRDRFERILLEERGRLLKEMGHLEDTVLNRSLRDSSGELSGYSFHMADIGTDAMEREKAFLFASAEGRALLDVNDALRRLYNGEYGMCESCGRPISVARLEVVPQARLCVRCKEKEERGRQGANPR